ncbi:hypothetical protein, partial [Thermococcus sp.]
MRNIKAKTFLLFFSLIVFLTPLRLSVILVQVSSPSNVSFPFFGGVYFDGVGLTPYSSPGFTPPVIVRGEVTKHKPYRTVFNFFNRNGSLIGNYTMKESFHAGYFYFKNG